MNPPRMLLPVVVSIAGVVAVICVDVAPDVWIIVPCWAIGAAYVVGQIRTGYADSTSPRPDPPAGCVHSPKRTINDGA